MMSQKFGLKKDRRRFFWPIITFLLMIGYPQTAMTGEDDANKISDRFGLTTTIGYNYDPSEDIVFALISGFALYDYDKIWPHSAPKALRFKVEAGIGATLKNEKGLMASAGIFALYYLDRFAGRILRPYVEGGIGGIYTQWRVEGQGSRINLNPQLGIGTELCIGSEQALFAAVRLHHISNAGLGDDNRGINSIVFQLGRFF